VSLLHHSGLLQYRKKIEYLTFLCGSHRRFPIQKQYRMAFRSIFLTSYSWKDGKTAMLQYLASSHLSSVNDVMISYYSSESNSKRAT
jgi:hypothetical protein